MTKVLMALSAADHWTLADGTKHPTGVWAEEFLAPYEVFTDAGYEVTIATPGGKAPSIDPKSLSITGAVLPTAIKRQKQQLKELEPLLNNPADLHTMDYNDFDVVFYPGGHGPMEDLSGDDASGKILRGALESGKMLGVICHSPAALVATVGNDGTTPFAGKELTGLSNVEENLNSMTNAKKAPWLLEDKLKELGINYKKAPLPFVPHVVVDGNLYSGQNPQSSKKLALAMVEAIDG